MAQTRKRPTKPGKVCVGAVAAAHGVRGLVTVKAFTEDPQSVAAYGPVETDDGQVLELSLRGRAGKGLLLAAVDGVSDRNGAERLRGQHLYVARAALPAADADDGDAYYHADLLGLPVCDRDGRDLGTVRAVHNFGAGDMLVIDGGPGGELTLPFTKAVVPEVDLAGRRIVVAPPAEVTVPPGENP